MAPYSDDPGFFSLWASDGSQGALAAAAAVRRFAVPGARGLRCLSVAPFQRSIAHRLAGVSQDIRREQLCEAEAAAQRSLHELGPLPIPTEAATCWGDVVPEVAREAAAARAGLVAVAASSLAPDRAGTKLGATARSLLQTLRRPVLVARPLPADSFGPVLLLFETRDSFNLCVDFVTSLALPQDVPLYLVALLEPSRPSGGMLATLNAEIRREHEVTREVLAMLVRVSFESARERLVAKGHRVETVVEECAVIEGLKTLASRCSASLVVTGGGKTPQQPFSPDRIAASVYCSVLTVR